MFSIRNVSRFACMLSAWWVFVFCAVSWGQPPAAPLQNAWTLETARSQLAIYPRDPYLQYVELQLLRREGRDYEAEQTNAWDDRRRGAFRRQEGVDLFSVFSGALAVQESLQLDAMTRLPTQTAQASTISMDDLIGPTVKSHPWEEMLHGRKPTISPLAKNVPVDFLLVKFRSVSKFLNALNVADELGSYVVNQASQEARSQGTIERLLRQLAIDTSAALNPDFDQVIDDFAIASSDIFYNEGSDVSLLLQLKQPQLFRSQMDAYLATVEKSNPGTKRSEGKELGVSYVHVTSPNRAVHVFACYPKPDLHLRTNSILALRRILETIQGKDASGNKTVSLGATSEYAYIRTMMPEGAEEEDGFIYMSDPFIRKLVGPQAKLTQLRRLTCYNHLRMIGHAALMHATENGNHAKSVDALKQSSCLPSNFGLQRLACPLGGVYRLSDDGRKGTCSHCGTCGTMVPCIEMPLEKVTEEEATAYKQFVTNYNQYWRTFFDPIAIRLQVLPARSRIETVILPLIDNSIYSSLARSLGGPTQALDTLPVPDRNILTVSVKLNKQNLIKELGVSELLAEAAKPPEPKIASTARSLAQEMRRIGLAILNYESAFRSLPPSSQTQIHPDLSWRVHILPYLEQQALYRQFHLDEPWDSEHNLSLVTSLPSIYRTAGGDLSAEGKTTIVMPRNPHAISNGNSGFRLTEITDGLSQTILLLEADRDHSVVWTKPDDLDIELDEPKQGWAGVVEGRSTALMCDGSTYEIPDSIDDLAFAALLTRNGGEPVPDLNQYRSQAEYRPMYYGLELARTMGLAELLMHGIGDQVSLNICDADPLIDFNVSQFLGMMVSQFNGRRGAFNIFDGSGLFTLLAISINAPVYVAVPVNDPQVVDQFLKRLDQVLVESALNNGNGWGNFLSIRHDFFRIAGDTKSSVRSYSFAFGPIKWRFYWARIGNGLYLASKPFIIEDLLALETNRAGAKVSNKSDDPSPVGHGMVRLRPKHWNEVLPQYQIGWAENQRLACRHNLGPLSSLSRAAHALAKNQENGKAPTIEDLNALAYQVFDSYFFCPSNGQYQLSKDGHSATCSVHGSADEPLQPAGPAPDTRLGAFVGSLSDVQLTLEFLEDGLHAVVTIDK